MLASMTELLAKAEAGGCALGAFNVYNLEGVRAVVVAAEAESSPVVLQVHPAAFRHGGLPLVSACQTAAWEAGVPMCVHLDHSTSADDIRAALRSQLRSFMADGSHLDYNANVDFTREMAQLARESGAAIEAELGRLSGTEDGLTVAEYEAKLTDPAQAAEFVEQTGIDMLAVCIGNVHGRYRGEPYLDFERLAAIQARVKVPLVLHGASGLPPALIQRAIELGVRKFNVNTEVREAYTGALKARIEAGNADLLDLIQAAEAAMRNVVAEKLHLFGSTGKAI
jgi:tagatose 1,6-diphosphate aldolase GatY/KbaY